MIRALSYVYLKQVSFFCLRNFFFSIRRAAKKGSFWKPSPKANLHKSKLWLQFDWKLLLSRFRKKVENSKTPEVKIQSGHTAGIAKRMPLLLSLGIVANRRISQYRLHSGFLAGQWGESVRRETAPQTSCFLQHQCVYLLRPTHHSELIELRARYFQLVCPMIEPYIFPNRTG